MNRPRTRLMIVSPFAPQLNAVHGGARAIARFIDGVSARVDVGLIYFRSPEEDVIDETITPRCTYLHEVPRRTDNAPPLRRAARRLRLLAGLLAGQPSWVAAFASRSFKIALQRAIRDFEPDVIQVEFHVMGQYIPLIKKLAPERNLPVVLVQHEPGIDAAKDRLRLRRGMRRLSTYVEWKAWLAYEPRIVRLADAVVTFTDRDREVIRKDTGRSDVDVVALPVPGPSIDHDGATAELPDIDVLFVGNFVHPPNRQAARRLLEVVMPAVWRQVPTCRVAIVGPDPGSLSGFGADERVFITGRVPRVEPYLERARVVSAPIYTGGGMRVKVMEALSHGCAVVASPLAVEGLNVIDGVDVVVATDDGAHADQIVRLLRDESARESLRAAARNWVDRNQTMGAGARAYESIYRRIMSRTIQ